MQDMMMGYEGRPLSVFTASTAAAAGRHNTTEGRPMNEAHPPTTTTTAVYSIKQVTGRVLMDPAASATNQPVTDTDSERCPASCNIRIQIIVEILCIVEGCVVLREGEEARLS